MAKMRGLAEALYNKTLSEDITWYLSTDKEVAIAELGMYRVSVTEVGSSSFSSDIKVSIFDSDWSEIDTFSDQSFGNTTPTVDGISTYFQLLSELLERAKRQVSGADRAMENLLTVLGGAPIEDLETKGGLAPNMDDDVPF